MLHVLQADDVPKGFHSLARAIGGPVVHYDQLEVLVGLSGDALNCASDVALAVEDRHRDAYFRIHFAYPSDQRATVDFPRSAFLWAGLRETKYAMNADTPHTAAASSPKSSQVGEETVAAKK